MKKFLLKLKLSKSFRKAMALALATLVLLQGLFVVPAMVDAAKSASSLTSVVQEDVYVDINKNIEDLDNRIYKFTLDASSYIKSEYRTSVQEFSEDGYYVIEEDGYYLVELWGGNGADGEDANDVFSENKGGIGGDAGYVYGYVYLTKGQTLLFTVGTDGEQSEVQSEGGGANEGGDHEVFSIYKVGGGGGYSAVFLFDETKTSYSLTESERLNNYIMIAGGGGGGGAAGNMLENTGNRPSGGNGGHITNSISGHLTADDNSGVAGTYFAGDDGLSSGTKTNYVGKGGTNVPGAVPTSWDGWSAVLNPNDWTGTYSDGIENEYHEDVDLTAGCGGMGACRGGAGGAGFCGGSGGFQSSPWFSATNIGGGGGGSSFIADSVTWQNLPDYVSDYLNDTNYSGVGGSCVITYLGAGLEDVDTSHMQNVEIAGSISKYFDILNVTSSNGTVAYDAATGDIVISGANIAPDDAGYPKNSVKIEIILRAKDNFAGGNYVPIIDNTFRLTPIDHDMILVNPNTSTDYVNVALYGFEAIGNSYMSNDPDHSYAVAELYTDNIASIKSGLLDWSTYISSISAYSVKLNASTITGSVSPDQTTTYTVQYTVTPKTTNIAVVGDPVSTVVYSDTATITIVEADAAGTLNGLDIDATKLLSYDGENYVLSTNVNQKGDEIFAPDSTYTSTTVGAGSWIAPADGWYYIQTWGGNGQGSGASHVDQRTAIHHATARRGQGGAGGYVNGYIYLTAGETLTYTIGESPRSTNPTSVSCSGTYTSISTSCSTILNYYAQNGHTSDVENANTGSSQAHGASSLGGAGGTFSRVSLSDGTTLIIAGGGGGAGGSAAAASSSANVNAKDHANGTTGGSRTTISSTLGEDSTYNGTSGGNGSYTAVYYWYGSDIDASAGTAGTAGYNYRDSRLAIGWDTANSGVYLTEGAMAYAESLGNSKGSNLNGQITITLLETAETQSDAEKLYGLETSGTISKYFDIEAIDLETAFAYTTRSAVTNNDGSITVTYTNGSATVAKVTYILTPNSDGSTSWSAYDTYYSPSATYTAGTKNGVSGNYITHSSSIDFALTLSPKDEFLGGNDVPLVWYGTTGSDDTGLRIDQNGNGLWLNKKDVSDYANVAINYSFNDNNFTIADTTIVCGESVDQAELITTNNIPLPTGDDAYKAEFVDVVYPSTATVSPRITTTYSFTQRVVPKAAAQKAVVLDNVEDVGYTKTATVYVDYTVTAELQNMTYQGPATVSCGDNLIAVLKAANGYLLPESISVTIGGSLLDDTSYTYNAETGRISIDADIITDNISISASAKIITYGIYYNYQDPVTEERIIIQETGHDGEWAAGETVDPDDLVKYNELNSGVVDRTGYKFSWNWGTADGSPITEMPAGDVYVLGLYEPIVYTVTVHYVEEGTNTLISDDYVGYYYYQDTFDILSPNVAGYLAKQTVISGSVGTENIELTVEYTKTQGQLNVIYIYDDSQREAAPSYTQEIKVNDTYEIVSPSFDGYTADQTVVSGIVTGEQADSGITVYVTYNPNQYTVSFDAAGGTLQSGDESKTVAYNNIYGFDPTKPYGEQYCALPTPIRTGYEFLGWVDTNGEYISEETIVALTSDHTLTAKWQGQMFTLTVNYYYSEVGGELAAEKFVTRVEYGDEYDFPSPYIEGYTPAPDAKGVMGAGSRIVNVVYTIDQHTITVKYIGPNGEMMTNDYEAVQDYNTDYSVASPVFDGYELDTDKNGDDLSIVSGTVGTKDITVKVYYKYINYTLTVNYQLDEELGDGVDRTPPSYVQEGFHIGDTYSVKSPSIEGYTANTQTVAGTVGSNDIVVAVTYIRNAHTLTINYLYDKSIADEALRGTEASEAYTESIKYAAEYSVDSPEVENYIVIKDVVSGVMPDDDVTVNVYYYDPDLTVSVTIEWGELTYNYNEAEWDAEAHEYFIPPEAADSNYVTVTNDDTSTIEVGADITYSASSGFEAVSGYFTADGSDEQLDAPHADIAVGNSIKYWLWLRGIMPDDIDYSQSTEQTTGVCTVTIGGAD